MVESAEFIDMLSRLICGIDDAEEDGEDAFARLEWLIREARPAAAPRVPLGLALEPVPGFSPWRSGGQDLRLLNELLLRCGRGLPFPQVLELHNSLQAFSRQLQISPTFFGRVQTRRGSYFAACHAPALLAAGPRPFPAAERELNELRFFAAGGADWVELPRICRRMVREARGVEWLWTGDLGRRQLPGFSGSEGQLLRCQLLRLACACWLAPKGAWELGEEGKLSPAAAFRTTAEDAMAAENQLHRFPYLRREGSFSPLLAAGSEEALKRAEEADPPVPPLRSISEENAAAWRMRAFGHRPRQASTPEPGVRTVFTWENVRWPGSATIMDPAQPHWAFFYSGSGFPEPAATLPPRALRPQEAPSGLPPAAEPDPAEEEAPAGEEAPVPPEPEA